MTHPVAKRGIACLLVGLLLLTVGCVPQGDSGISARYATREWQTTLDVSLQILSKETMELARAACEDYTPAPHLGDAAWFDEDAERLYVFFGDYQLSVYIDSESITASRLILTRHFAALVLEGLS